MMRPSLRPGLVSVTFRPLSVREIVDLAASCGLEGIEWGGDVHVRNPAEAREARRATEDAGLAVASYGSYWRAEDSKPSEAIDGLSRVMETAAYLQAPTIRVWAGTFGSRSVDGSYKALVVDALHDACEFVSSADMTISLEYHGGTLTDTLASTFRLVRRVDHPALRVYWQPVPERSPEERLGEVAALLPWLSNLHVFQWAKSPDGTVRHPLAEGGREWSEVFQAAQGERFALLEFVPNDDPSLLPREAATLRRLLTPEGCGP